MNLISPAVFNHIPKATRQIRSNWSEKERTFRRRLAQFRTQQILDLIQKSGLSAN